LAPGIGSGSSIQRIKHIFGERNGQNDQTEADGAAASSSGSAVTFAESPPTASVPEAVKEGWLNCKVAALEGKVCGLAPLFSARVKKSLKKNT